MNVAERVSVCRKWRKFPTDRHHGPAQAGASYCVLFACPNEAPCRKGRDQGHVGAPGIHCGPLAGRAQSRMRARTLSQRSCADGIVDAKWLPDPSGWWSISTAAGTLRASTNVDTSPLSTASSSSKQVMFIALVKAGNATSCRLTTARVLFPKLPNKRR